MKFLMALIITISMAILLAMCDLLVDEHEPLLVDITLSQNTEVSCDNQVKDILLTVQGFRSGMVNKATNQHIDLCEGTSYFPVFRFKEIDYCASAMGEWEGDPVCRSDAEYSYLSIIDFIANKDVYMVPKNVRNAIHAYCTQYYSGGDTYECERYVNPKLGSDFTDENIALHVCIFSLKGHKLSEIRECQSSFIGLSRLTN